MPLITLGYAVSMVVLGVGMYGVAASGMIEGTKASVTALIPAFASVPFFLFGLLSMAKDSLRKHLMHAAAALALLLAAMGLFMAVGGLVKAGFDVSQLQRPLATVGTALMGLLSTTFVVLCVKSFIAARKARLATAA